MTRAVVRDDEGVNGINHRAKEVALAALSGMSVEVAGVVNYSSSGRLLVVGEDVELVEWVVRSAAPMTPSVLLLGHGGKPLDQATTWWSPREAVRLEGWLGDFRVSLDNHGPAEVRFDLVLDLCDTPVIDTDLPPPGYRAHGPLREGLEERLAELRDLVGEFEKPRYFRYDPDICAHGMKGVQACRRCIDACPAGAVTSLVDRVQVESKLCQGGGACATACPTGAMTYGFPAVEDSLERVRRLLRGYREAGGSTPVLLVHAADDGAAGANPLTEVPAAESGHLLPVPVEEVASLGLEAWFTALAYGASAVRLLASSRIPQASRRTLDEQIGFARAMLAGLGFPESAIGWLDPHGNRVDPAMPPIEPSSHAAVGGKRQILFNALDHLFAQSERKRPLATLPAGAPFGTVAVDHRACTLCMACATVCPAHALQDGQDVPQLRFVEANCVQCGLCTRSCPEDALWITPRILFDAQARGESRLLREDTPFHCVSCGTPFATTSVIGRMEQRLAGHSMFQDAGAFRRLQMCGDCRVADMMRAEEI